MDLDKIDDVSFAGIDHSDYPDYCDAYVEQAWWDDGRELTEEELDELSKPENQQWVYERLMKYLN